MYLMFTHIIRLLSQCFNEVLWRDEIHFAMCGSPFGQPFVHLNVGKWWKVQYPWEGHLKVSENNFICKKQKHDPFPISMGIFSLLQWPMSLGFVKLILWHTKAIFRAVWRLQEGLTSQLPSHAVFWSVPQAKGQISLCFSSLISNSQFTCVDDGTLQNSLCLK